MDFKKAISVAEENARELVPNARNFNLEGVIISGDNYEVTISYYLSGQNPLELKGENGDSNPLYKLATLMGTRREYKTFIVDKGNFAFKGFKSYKET
ncbi:hypothetical protein [Vogesella fluminis]|uniref:Uncharacterized protein n=1 Tax=Vogesella fluminis TaxID=1069161 RepID=A0ABQ3HGZ8_9NEIS|nr:hypothetical protein [Vogesella fluminis]GHD82315.1 hypothetical protein GCM10011419_29670 [Vogesella fluminis]